MRFRRRTRLLYVLLFVVAWLASASWTESAFAQFILCQPTHSPCCPTPENNNSESCPACQLTASTAAQETRSPESRQDQRQRDLLRIRVSRRQGTPVKFELRREFQQGFHYQARVFDLKDDLRV
jgi:hypothetical protein